MINKARLDKAIQSYVQSIGSKDLKEIILWDDCLYNYKQHWDIEHLDFLSTFELSFKSTISTRLWKGDNFYPLEVMKEFIGYEKEIIRSLFRDLLNESRSLDGRMERFVFYCDQLLNEVRDRGKIYPNHYHGDYYMPSLYVAMEFPDKYWFYNIEMLRTALINLGDLQPPPSHDVNRYYKVLNLLDNLLSKDQAFTQWREKIRKKLKYRDETKMWSYDLLKFTAQMKIN